MKKTVPNLSAVTGVSHSFRIAFGNLSNHLERIRDNDPPRTRHLAKRAFLHRAIPHYEEYFDPGTYTDVLTESNREVVARINAVIDTINELRRAEIVDYDRLHPLEQTLLSLISGKPLDKA